MKHFLLMILPVVLAVAPAIYGQASDGNVVGTITDQSGASIPNATVVLANMETGVTRTATTDTSGSYRFPNVLVGRYEIQVTAAGFLNQKIKNLVVELNRTLTSNVTLQVGQVTTSVEVSEASASVDTTTAQVASTYESRQSRDLALASNVNAFNNLGAINLSLLSAGVASSGGVGQGQGPSVGGQRPTNNNFVIDGIDNNRRDVTGPIAVISNEATGNFTLIQNMMAPEFGHSSGGTFNVIPKSGTNTIHGSLYDYMQNRNFNALDAAVKRQGISERPRFDQNRMGGTIGGPIVKNKLFYFGNFEYIPYGAASTPAGQVQGPTSEGYAILDRIPGINQTNYGIFKQYVPVAPSASKTIQVGNFAVPVGNLPIAAPFYINSWNYLGNIDYNLTDADQLRFRFVGNNQRYIDNTPTLPAFFGNVPTNSYLTSLSYLRNISPTMLNEARFAYTRYFNDTPVGDFTFPGLDMFPNIAFTGELNVQIGPDPNGPQSTVINTYTLVDNVSKIIGRHTLKFGYDGRRVIAPSFFVQRVRGDYGYTTLSRYLFDLNPDDISERSFGGSAFWGNLWSHYAFANDDFKISRNVTLNLGIRYEYVGVPAGNKTQSLNSLASVPGVIDFHEPTAQHNNWAPRVGVAWSPGKDGTWAVRAGFGMAYDQLYQNLGSLSLPPQFFTTVDTDLSANTPGFLAGGGILPPPGLGANMSPDDARALTSAFVPDQKRPYSINWTFGVQKVLKNDYTVEVRYLGNRGVNLPAQIRLNEASVVNQSRNLPTLTQTPSQDYLNSLPLTLGDLENIDNNIWSQYGFASPVVGFMPIGNSTYHGLATQVTKRFSKNFSFVGAYTWSHNIDDGTAAVFSTLIQPRRPQDFLNYRPERASSALDRRQRFSMSGIYETPWFNRDSNTLRRTLLGGYVLSGTYIAESPMMATVQSGIDANLNGDSAGDRAIINPTGQDGVGSSVTPLCKGGPCADGLGDPNTVAYLANNPNARFIQAGYGALANGGRSLLPLRGINNFDLSVMKRFNITENHKIEFRAEMYNAFNHSQYTPGQTNNAYYQPRTDTRAYLIPGNDDFNNPETAFGNNARTIQFALRYQF